MEILEVQTHENFIDRQLKASPKDALNELIWNACDADATNIRVNFARNEADQVFACTIMDDGCGIDREKINDNFQYIGFSEKQHKIKSDGGRIYHGKLGKGRYNALSVAKNIVWDTVYLHEGKYFNYTISMCANNKTKINVSEVLETEEVGSTGTKVAINFADKKGNAFVDLKETIENFIEVFAPYLKAYPQVNIYFDNNLVNINEYIIDYQEHNIDFLSFNGTPEVAKLILINWKSTKNKGHLQFCDVTGTAIETGSALSLKGVDAYLCSRYFSKPEVSSNLKAYNLDDVLNELVAKAKEIIDNYIASIRDDEILRELDDLKSKKIYPYLEEPKTDTERIEQSQFKVLAVEVNKILPQLKKATQTVKKTTYALLKETVKTSPDSFTEILNSIVALTDEQKDALAKLLQTTSMSAIIKTSQLLVNRSRFLDALHLMVYDETVEKGIKERTQFQHILLDNLWIFGDDYSYGADDVSIRNILKAYVKSLGRQDLIPEIPKEAEADLSRIPDICLFKKYPLGNETFKNLVVEIKKPKKILGKKEYDQIVDYYDKISKNSAFPGITTKWHFILVGRGVDDYVKARLSDYEKQFGHGNIVNNDYCVVSILTWGEIIQRNKAKIEYLTNSLEMQVGEESDIIQFLHDHYGKYVTDKI